MCHFLFNFQLRVLCKRNQWCNMLITNRWNTSSSINLKHLLLYANYDLWTTTKLKKVELKNYLKRLYTHDFPSLFISVVSKSQYRWYYAFNKIVQSDCTYYCRVESVNARSRIPSSILACPIACLASRLFSLKGIKGWRFSRGGSLQLGTNPLSSHSVLSLFLSLCFFLCKGLPLKDEKDGHKHEPLVQARQHRTAIANGMSSGGMGGVGVRHHGVGARMSPLEIGMYVLLAAFCFAIVVFVVSCVVYASKFKPQPPDSPGLLTGAAVPVLAGARAAANQLASGRRIHHQRPPRESTTNAHDWVWLGRATLERAACGPQQVRMTCDIRESEMSTPWRNMENLEFSLGIFLESSGNSHGILLGSRGIF